MAMWKQALVSVFVVAVVGVAWYFFFPGAQDVLARFGVAPMVVADAATPGTATAGNRTGGAPGAAPAGRGGGLGGARETLVVAEAATSSTINDKLTALGDGTSLHSVTITPSAAGTLDEVLAANGAEVKAGEVIARLNSDAEQIAYDKARLALTDAQSTLDRYTQLKSASSVTAAQMQSSQLALDTAQLTLASADLALRNRRIVAPIGGRIGIVQVDAGNAVTTQSVIATIEDRSAILISFWVPERLIGALKVGGPVEAVPIARPQERVSGEIIAIDNRVDSTSGTFEVQARVPNDKDDLRAGMSFTVSMSFPGDTFVAVNPLSIQWGSSGAYVWLEVEGKAKRADVRIVQRNTESVLVAGDINQGDMVIVEGLNALRDGAAVKVADASGATNAQAAGQGGQEAASGQPGEHRTGSGRPGGQRPVGASQGVAPAQSSN